MPRLFGLKNVAPRNPVPVIVASRQDRVGEVRAGEVGAGEVGAREVRVVQVEVGEALAGEIHARSEQVP